MPVLTRRALTTDLEDIAHADLAPRPIKVLQIGDGNFLRAFVDWMIDVANEKGTFGGGVAIAQPLPQGGSRLCWKSRTISIRSAARPRRRPRDDRHGASCSTVQVSLDPYARVERVPGDRRLARFAVRRLQYDRGRHRRGSRSRSTSRSCPKSFPGQGRRAPLGALVGALGPDAPGLVFLPCELIEANGATLRRIVLNHARCWDLEPRLRRLDRSAKNVFLDTLVDRIVPGFPGAEKGDLVPPMGLEGPARGRRRALPRLGDPGAEGDRRRTAARRGRPRGDLDRRPQTLPHPQGAHPERRATRRPCSPPTSPVSTPSRR